MTMAELVAMIDRARAAAYEPRDTPDCALKMYFYPLSGALFSTEEWEGFMEKDEVTVRPEKRAWVIREMGERLRLAVAGMGLDELYLTVVSYSGPGDVAYHIDADRTGTRVSICALVPWTPGEPVPGAAGEEPAGKRAKPARKPAGKPARKKKAPAGRA